MQNDLRWSILCRSYSLPYFKLAKISITSTYLNLNQIKISTTSYLSVCLFYGSSIFRKFSHEKKPYDTFYFHNLIEVLHHEEKNVWLDQQNFRSDINKPENFSWSCWNAEILIQKCVSKLRSEITRNLINLNRILAISIRISGSYVSHQKFP